MINRQPENRQPLRRQTGTHALSGTPDFLFLILTFGILGFGIAMVFSSSSMTASYTYHDIWHFFIRQMIFAVIGVALMIFIMKTPFDLIKRVHRLYLIGCIGMLVLVLLIGSKVNGARSWFGFGSFGIQPTEFAKLGLIMYLAAFISKKGDKYRFFKEGLLKTIIVTGLICGLVILQPDLGGVIIIALTAYIVMFVGGANFKQFVMLTVAGVILLLIIGMGYMLTHPDFLHSYRVARFTAFIDPWNDPQKTGYHIIQSLFAFAHGNIIGTGFGQSIQKLHYLPEAHNDFIFAIIGEEFGFLGTSLFLIAYACFILRGYILSMRCRDAFGSLVGIGIMTCIMVQSIVNLFGVSGLIPLTGVTLPLISYGGSSLIVTLMGVGIILNASRQDKSN